jgi:hypothetical protein
MIDIKEVGALWDKVMGIDKKMSDFADMLHAKSQNDVTDLQEAVTDEMYDQINRELIGE